MCIRALKKILVSRTRRTFFFYHSEKIYSVIITTEISCHCLTWSDNLYHLKITNKTLRKYNFQKKWATLVANKSVWQIFFWKIINKFFRVENCFILVGYLQVPALFPTEDQFLLQLELKKVPWKLAFLQSQ